MENNNKDFMKNRPVASEANQIQDVYGSQSSSARTTVSVVLSVIMFVLTLISIIIGNNLMTVIFAPVFALLLISFFVARRADRQNAPIQPTDSNEAIFKEHEI